MGLGYGEELQPPHGVGLLVPQSSLLQSLLATFEQYGRVGGQNSCPPSMLPLLQISPLAAPPRQWRADQEEAMSHRLWSLLLVAPTKSRATWLRILGLLHGFPEQPPAKTYARFVGVLVEMGSRGDPAEQGP